MRSTNGRPKLLFLAHSFPPANTSGSVRTWNTSKYLARLGWDITVVTPHPSLCRKLESPDQVDARMQHEGIRRILTAHRWRCLLPEHLKSWNHGVGRYVGGICRRVARRLGVERGIGWIKATEHACEPLKPQDVDLILATGLPFASFTLARRLSRRLGCPYVLDYRDPWTGNPHTAHPFRPAVIRKERRLLTDAAAVTIVSPSWAAALDGLFTLGPKLHVVTNGYDLEELGAVKPHEFGHCAIVYAGTFYPPKRVISPVMAALRQLKAMPSATTPAWFFHYYGEQEDHVWKEAKRFGVEGCIVAHGHVPRSHVLSGIRGARIAVVITSVAEDDSFEDQGIVPGKLFETLGLGTPVLLIAPPGSDVDTILAGTQGGRRLKGSDVDGIAAFLMDAIHSQGSRPKVRESYGWSHIASYLDAVLRKAMISA